METRHSSTLALQSDPLFLQEMLSLFRQTRLSDLYGLTRRHGLPASVNMALHSYDQAQGERRDSLKPLLRQLYLWLEDESEDYSWSEDLAERRQEFIKASFLAKAVGLFRVLPDPLKEAAVFVLVPAIYGLALATGLVAAIFPALGERADDWIDTLTACP